MDKNKIEIIDDNLKKIKNYFSLVESEMFTNVNHWIDICEQRFEFDNLLFTSMFIKFLKDKKNMYSFKKIKGADLLKDESIQKFLIKVFFKKITGYESFTENSEEIEKLHKSSNFDELKKEIINLKRSKINDNLSTKSKDIFKCFSQSFSVLENSKVLIRDGEIFNLTKSNEWLIDLLSDYEYGYIYSIYFFKTYYECLFKKIGFLETFKNKFPISTALSDNDNRSWFYDEIKLCISSHFREFFSNNDKSTKNFKRITGKIYNLIWDIYEKDIFGERNNNEINFTQLNESVYISKIAYFKINKNDANYSKDIEFNLNSVKNYIDSIKRFFYEFPNIEFQFFNINQETINAKNEKIANKPKQKNSLYFINGNRKIKDNFSEETLYGKDFEKSKKIIDEFEERLSSNQNIFRENLLNLYNGQCLLTNLKIEKILIASHIVAWRDLKNNELSKKYNINNGLLLAASIDKLFDNNIISFTDEGKIHIPTKFTIDERNEIEDFLKKSGVDEGYFIKESNINIYDSIKKFSDEYNSRHGTLGVVDIDQIKENMKIHREKSDKKSW